ncbi:MAG: HAMP domain-containing histidine kinase [Candidatus Magnetomorum sp.]|nr:HAMP domain-containing histidine kinase [Candidatus Magnetomorum sp.]
MKKSTDLLKYESLAFFGKVNASISHELKNIMAIISETAGLLSDMADMASTENPVSPESLKSYTGSVIEEIQRGFNTIRQMNRFSHSVDTPITEVNLIEMIDLVIQLTGYLSFAGKAHVHNCGDSKPFVKTCPFLLQAVIYQALVNQFKNGGPGMETTVSVCSQDQSIWRVIFSDIEQDSAHVFPDDNTKDMAEAIGVKIICTANRLELDIPSSIETVS